LLIKTAITGFIGAHRKLHTFDKRNSVAYHFLSLPVTGKCYKPILQVVGSNDTLKTFLFFHRDLNPIGSRALSHDSIFIPEEPAPEAGLDHSMSQENVSDKVRNLQVGLVALWPCGGVHSMHEELFFSLQP